MAVTISVDDVVVGEDAGFVDFIIRLNEVSATAVTVNWETNSQTASINDYSSLSGSLTFAPGVRALTVRIPITNDNLDEVNEAFTLRLYNPSNNVTLAESVGTAIIVDNDAPSGTPVVSISDFVIDEAAGEASFVIILDRPSGLVVSLNYATLDGGAVAGSDYTAVSGSLNFAPGQTVHTVKVPLTNDTVTEGSEAFNLVISNLVNASTLDAVGTAVIGANDATPSVKPNILVDDVVVGEGQDFVDFIVRLDAPGTSAVTVNWETNSQTASINDYTSLSGYLTFSPGETIKTVRIPITNDNLDEVNEAFTLRLYNPSNNVSLAESVGTAIIIDNDAPSGTPVVSISDFVIDEAAGEASFVIILDRPSGLVVSLNYATQDGGAVAGSDYTAVSGSLNFAPGQTVHTVKVPLTNDTVTEGSEAFNLVISNLVNATTLDAVGTAVVGANDATPSVKPNILVDDVVVGEGQDFVDFIVRLDAPGTSAVTVNWETNSQTASINDYTSLSGYLTFSPGESIKTVRIPITNDNLVEVSQAFTLRLYNPSNNVTLAKSVGTAIIVDNDAPSGTPVVSISDFVIDEAAGEASFVIILDRPSGLVVSLNYATQDGGAVAGSDYTSVSGSLNFAPGQTVHTVKVPLTNDTVTEGSEAFNLVVSNLVNATTLDAVGTAVIGANDATPSIKPNILVDDVVVGEGQDFVDFIVRLDAPGTSAVTVNWETNSQTASINDYTSLSGYLTFSPGETIKTVRIPLTNDNLDEVSQAFTLRLYNPSNNVTLAKSVGTAIIVDNDAPSGTPVVSISDFVIDEAAGEASFVIILDRPSGLVVSLNYAAQDGGAVAGSDYTAVSGSVNFAPGQTVHTVKVPLTNDTVTEGSEAFNLVISNLVNATTLDAVGTAVIGANDATPSIKPNILVDDVVVGEGQDFVDFIVRLDAPGTSAVTVNWETNSQTASINDYTSLSGYLTFSPGETTKTVRIPITNDNLDEVNEAFTLRLYNPSNNVTLAKSVGTAIIVDDDGVVAPPATLNGTGNADVLFGGNAGETINAGDGDDIAFGQGGNDTVNGGQGHDSLDGGTGSDLLTGGTGNDTFYVDSATDDVVELSGQGTDLVVASASYSLAGRVVENLTLTGSAHFDATGNGLGNTLTGNAGNNSLDGGGASDTLIGGAGNDTYYVQAIGDAVVELPGEGTDLVVSSLTWSLAGMLVENLSLTGSADLNGTGNSLGNSLTGNAGHNVLDGGAGSDTLTGGLGNDTYYVDAAGDSVVETAGGGTDLVIASVSYSLAGKQVENLTLTGAAASATGNGLANVLTGNGGANMLDAGAGHDSLDGGAGTDTLIGGSGNDSYLVDSTGDVITEAAGGGADAVWSSVTYTLSVDVESLTLTGTAAINGTGNAVGNVLTGNTGNNVLSGGLGNDTYYVQNTGDAVVELGGEGTDVIFSAVTYSLSGRYAETINLTGSNNINATGNSLTNTLVGNDGSNTINGKGGKDSLTGGLGADVFLFEASNGKDTITDFSAAQNDSINVNAYTGGVANNSLVAQVGGNVVITFDASNTITVIGATQADVLAHMVW